MTGPISSPAAGIEVRRNQLERVSDAGGGVFESVILVDVYGRGEAFIHVNFPIRYTEKPAIASGFEVADGTPLNAGHYPMANAGVFNWDYGLHPWHGQRYYDGASLVLSVTGPPPVTSPQTGAVIGPLTTVHLTFRGKGIRAMPATSTGPLV